MAHRDSGISSFFAPFPNILISAVLQHISVSRYISSYDSPGWMFLNFAHLPIAAVAIFAFRRWSYPVFLGCMAWAGWVCTQNWLQFPNSFPLTLLIGTFAVNIAITSYFLIPSVRAPYFDKKLRWWERKPRFLLQLSAEVKTGFSTSTVKIANIAEGGVFVTSPRNIPIDEKVKLSFNLFDMEFSLEGRTIYKRPGKPKGYGIQFTQSQPRTKFAIETHGPGFSSGRTEAGHRRSEQSFRLFELVFDSD